MNKYLILGVMLCFGFLFQQACSSPTNNDKPPVVVNEKGKNVFKTYCILCHGADGKLGLNGAMDMTQSILTLDERIQVITNGRNTMAPYKGVLDEDEIKAVAEYTMIFKTSE